MKFVRRLCAVAVGAVFFVAGLLKLMDPVGASLVVKEYLNFLHLRFLLFSSGVVSEVLSLLETCIGAALVTGVWRKVTALLTAAFLSFFTILTLALWISGPVMDCGCFGEAIHLTHAQSFLKNVVLCALWAVAFLPFSRIGEPARSRYVAFFITIASVVAFAVYSLVSVPLKDYTDYAPGAELRLSGEEGLEDLPILSFFDEDGNYSDSLALKGNVMVISVYNTASFRGWKSLEPYMAMLERNGFKALLLCSGDMPVEGYYSDGRQLMGLNRSNGGLTYICDAQIVAKWSAAGRPDEEGIKRIITTGKDQVMMNRLAAGKISFQLVLLYSFAVMLLI